MFIRASFPDQPEMQSVSPSVVRSMASLKAETRAFANMLTSDSSQASLVSNGPFP